MEGVSRSATGVAVDSLSNDSYVSHAYATHISNNCPVNSQREATAAAGKLPPPYSGEVRRDLLRLANQLQHEKVGHFITVDSIVNIEDLLAAAEAQQPGPTHSSVYHPHQSNAEAENNALLSYLGSSDSSTTGGCLVQLEPVEHDHMESASFSAVESSYVSMPSESIPYDHALLEHRLDHAFEENPFLTTNASPSEDTTSSDRPTVVARNVTAVPVQIVRPQQHKSNVTTSTTDDDSAISTSSTKLLPKTRPSRKRGARTASLGSSSDEGSVLNASSNSEGGDGCADADASKHRRTKQPVPDAKKDEKYWRRRLKNNLAAKRSREARKQKESQTSVKAAYLEEQHSLLRKALDEARQQNEELRKRLSRYENVEQLPKIGNVLHEKNKWKEIDLF